MAEKSFHDKVYEIARQIPYGKVTSYGAIAKCIGAPRSARMVGWALNKSSGKDVPAHRVVNRIGMLSGKFHFDGTTLMSDLLESEGLLIEDDQVVDFKANFWDPAELFS